MRFTKRKAAGIAAIAAVFMFFSGPAAAGGPASISDPSGLDYDPSCVFGTVPPQAPPPPNSIKSMGNPGGTVQGGDGCIGVSTYDGGAEGIDFNNTGTTSPAVSLESVTSSPTTHYRASFDVDGAIPAPGSTTRTAFDLPDDNFVGGNYYALFQNKSIQTNTAYAACPPLPPRPTPLLQRFGHWADGYHFFVSFSVSWDGTKWIYAAQLGEYDPDGGFGFFELGTSSSVDAMGNPVWVHANPHHTYGTGATQWNVTVDSTNGRVAVTAPGVYESPNTSCDTGTNFKYKFGVSGDVIANVKGLSTANQVVTLPVTVPASITCTLPTGTLVCEPDITTVGGFVFWADTTDGTSNAGLANTNISGIALTGGLIGVTDTLGDGPTCATPTVGGALPDNPLFTPGNPCQIDDDPFRGSLFQEFWDTVHGFTF